MEENPGDEPMNEYAIWVFGESMRACMADTQENQRFSDELSLKTGLKNKKMTIKQYEDEYVKNAADIHLASSAK